MFPDLNLRCWYLNDPESPDPNLSLTTVHLFHQPPVASYRCVPLVHVAVPRASLKIAHKYFVGE